jgi:alpha-tubulin suppressor-like RCC1 family protein
LESPKKTTAKTDWLEIATAHNHSCACGPPKGIFCWGNNGFGEFGNSKQGVGSCGAVQMPGQSALQLAVGSFFTCFRKEDDTVACTDRNQHGQLGASSKELNVTAAVASLGGQKVKSIVAGWHHACAIGQDDQVRCWGAGDEGALGDGKAIVWKPVAVAGLP